MAVVEGIPQHMAALARANRTRLARAELRRRLYAGEVSAADVIAECPPEAETMTVFDVLDAQRRWGRTRALRVLDRLRLPESKAVGAMTVRQRDRLLAALRGEDITTGDGWPW